MEPQYRSKIEEIKKGLYSRNAPDVLKKRPPHLRPEQSQVTTDWEHPEEVAPVVSMPPKYSGGGMSFLTKIFLASLVFFVVALSLGAYIFFKGGNIVSANNVDILVSGPVSIAGGDLLALDVSVYNRNNIRLEVVDLSVEFPAGTVQPDDTTKELKTFRELMSDIDPGGFAQKGVRAILYGEENTTKQIKIRVEYRVKGSNATFQKEKIYDILLSSAPLSLKVSGITETNSGQEFNLAVTVTSNSKVPLRNLLLKGRYPFGYTFISSDSKAITPDNTTWRLGDIPPGTKKTITIKGKIEGQDEEERVFRFGVGTQSAKNDKTIATEFVATGQAVVIKKPFLAVNVLLEGDANNNDYVGSFDQPIRAEVTWFNNLSTSITNAEIHVTLAGNAYDKLAVNPEQGLFKSANNEIVWSNLTTPELASIGAGESGRVSFRLTPKDLSGGGRSVVNPQLLISVSARASRSSENNVPVSIQSLVARTIRVASSISLASQVLRQVGPFENTGPFPPRAEKSSTYTVVWGVYNTTNNVANAQVRTVLPPYVKWTGKIMPLGEAIQYNPADGSVAWNIGDIPAYTGSGTQGKREVAFQISLEPSVSQIGQSPVLMNDSVLTADDTYTGVPLKSTRPAQSTKLISESGLKDQDFLVQP